MCRMMAITDSHFARPYRELILDQLMLASFSDGYQDSGCGVSDGHEIRKAAQPYLVVGPMWHRSLADNSIWMGHVRRASRGTWLTPHEAHPFMFPLADGSTLIAQHNGFINGFDKRVAGEPNVDSYRAFKLLAELVTERRTINADLINSWISNFGEGSEWTFMLQHHGDLYIARGDRPMHFMSLGNGHVFATSIDVLLYVKNWIRSFWPHFKPGKITAIAQYTFAHARHGSDELDIAPLTQPVKVDPQTDRYLVINPEGTRSIKL
jgi:hypothetical protein